MRENDISVVLVDGESYAAVPIVEEGLLVMGFTGGALLFALHENGMLSLQLDEDIVLWFAKYE